MMADLGTLQHRLEKLRASRASGVTEISYDGESIRYRSDSEMAAAIADIERQIAAQTTKPVRSIRVGTNKGF